MHFGVAHRERRTALLSFGILEGDEQALRCVALRFQRPITQLCRASLPFLAILLVALALITYIPDLSLGLVRLLGYADLPVFRR